MDMHDVAEQLSSCSLKTLVAATCRDEAPLIVLSIEFAGLEMLCGAY